MAASTGAARRSYEHKKAEDPLWRRAHEDHAGEEVEDVTLRHDKTLSETLAKHRSKTSQIDVDEPHWIVDNRWFTWAVTIIVVANAMQIGMSVDLRGPDWDIVWEVTEIIFTVLFTLEMLIKLACLRWTYFSDRWNILDFGLVLMALTDLIMIISGLADPGMTGSLTVLRILRLARVIRMVRMLKVFKELVVLIDAIVKSVRTMAWVLLLLCLVLYVYAILCVEVIGSERSYPGYNPEGEALESAADGFNNFQYFGTIVRSMYSLFSLITLSEWSTISRPIAERQPFVVPSLIAFTMLTAFGVMNVVIGTMVEHALEASTKYTKVQEEDYKTTQMGLILGVAAILDDCARESGSDIALSDLEKAIETNEALASLLVRIDLPQNCTLNELLLLIDDSGDGAISPDEFQSAMYRMVYCSDFQRMCLMQMSLNKLKQMFHDFEHQASEHVHIPKNCDSLCQQSEADPRRHVRNDIQAPESTAEEIRKLRSEIRDMRAEFAFKLDGILTSVPGDALSTTAMADCGWPEALFASLADASGRMEAELRLLQQRTDKDLATLLTRAAADADSQVEAQARASERLGVLARELSVRLNRAAGEPLDDGRSAPCRQGGNAAAADGAASTAAPEGSQRAASVWAARRCCAGQSPPVVDRV